MLNLALLTVAQLDLEFFLWFIWGDRRLFGFFRFLWLSWFFIRCFIYRLAIPFRVGKMMVRINKVIDGEIVFAVEQACASTYNLLEFNDRIYRTHQHDVADIAGIHAGGELLRGSENRRDRFFVILKLAQVF